MQNPRMISGWAPPACGFEGGSTAKKLAWTRLACLADKNALIDALFRTCGGNPIELIDGPWKAAAGRIYKINEASTAVMPEETETWSGHCCIDNVVSRIPPQPETPRWSATACRQEGEG
jgi:hypothetical protein